MPQPAGQSQDNYRAIVQDRTGFMWFATHEGLLRYDGYTFVRFVHDPENSNSLADDHLYDMCLDGEGNIWVATARGGATSFDPRRGIFTRHRHDPHNADSLVSDRLYKIHADAVGNVWIGSWADGLDCWNPKTKRFSHFRNNPADANSLSSDMISAIHCDRSGILWIGTWGGGLNRFDPATGTFSRFQNDPRDDSSLSNDKVTAIIDDDSGNLWIGTGGGLNRLLPEARGAAFVRYLHRPGDASSLSHNDVRAFCLDDAGRLWIGTYGGGLSIYNPQERSFHRYVHNPGLSASLSSNMVFSIFKDRSGIVWIGTIAGGLNKVNPRRERFNYLLKDPDAPMSLSNNEITALCQGRDGIIWIGTWSGGLNRWMRGSERFDVFMPENDLPPDIYNNAVRCIFQDRRGDFLVGTSKNFLYRFDPASGRFTPLAVDLPAAANISAMAMAEDGSGNLWVGTNGAGLVKLDPQRRLAAVYRHKPGDAASLSHDDVRIIRIVEDGTLWVGTYRGICWFDPGRGSFSIPSGLDATFRILAESEVLYFHQDEQLRVWIGTARGLFSYFPQTSELNDESRRYNLPSCRVGGILSDGLGNLWLMTNKGLIRLNPGSKRFRIFALGDGLTSTTFFDRACLRARSGELFFGTANGICWLDPETSDIDPFIPSLAIAAVRTAGGRRSFPPDLSGIQELVFRDEELPLTFELSALCFGEPGKNRYAYKLEERGTGWVELGTNRLITLTSLPPGRSTLRFKGSNADGIWNEGGLAVRLLIIAPLWKRPWFWLAVLGFLAGSAGLAVWLLRRRAPKLVQAFDPNVLSAFCARHRISKREKDVIELLIQGMSYSRIKDKLFISMATVKSHLTSIYQKAGVKNRVELLFRLQNFKL